MDLYIIGVCLATWIGFSYWSASVIRRWWRMRSFVPISATITHVGLKKVPSVASNEFGSSQETTVLQVSYRFELDGQVHKGTHEGGYFAYASDDDEQVRPLYQGRLSRGDAIEVFYNPTSPAEHTHRRGLSLGAWLVIGVGQLFLLLSLRLIREWIET